MWDAIQLILLLTVYVLVTYFIVKFTSKLFININPYLRLLTLSFLYALFWGIGIAGNGGDPGFAFPAPNIVALGLMISIGFYRGVFSTGLYILGFWWTIFFLVMLVKFLMNKKKSVQIT